MSLVIRHPLRKFATLFFSGHIVFILLHYLRKNALKNIKSSVQSADSGRSLQTRQPRISEAIKWRKLCDTNVLAIYKDFHAKVFTKNITVILAHPAQRIVKQESQGKKYVYQVNMANAFSKMKESIVFLFQRSDILSEGRTP